MQPKPEGSVPENKANFVDTYHATKRRPPFFELFERILNRR